MSLRKTLKRGNKQAFIRLFIYLFISCIALYLCLNLNTPAKQTHWTRDKVDFCCYNPLDITVSSLEWDARLLQIPPPPPRNFMIQVVWEKIAILRWVGQHPRNVWGPTPLNVVFSIRTRFHFWLNTFQVAVYCNFRFDLFLFLEGRIRWIRHRYREYVSLVLAAFVNTIHFLIR